MRLKEVIVSPMSQRVKVRKKFTEIPEEEDTRVCSKSCPECFNVMPCNHENDEEDYEEDYGDEEDVHRNVEVFDLTVTQSNDITVYNSFENTTKTLVRNIARVKTNKVAIFGYEGSGKNTLIKYFANRILQKQVPELLFDTKVLMIDCSMLEYINYPEVMKSVMETYNETEGTTKFVWVIDNFETIPAEAAAYFETNIKAVTSTYSKQLDLFKIFMIINKEAFRKREEIFEMSFWSSTVGVTFKEEKKPNKIIEVLAPEIRKLEKAHGAHISKELLILTIYMLYGKGVDGYEVRINYNKFLGMVDYILAIVELDGRKEVVKQDIITGYENDFNVYNEYSEFDRKRFAYHEAGHTLIALVLPEHYELLAVKAICDSTSDAAGITIVMPKSFFHNYKGLIKTLAFSLGGRVAEEIYGHMSGEGAVSDLDMINGEAIDYISRCGANKKFGKNFVADPECISPKQLEILEEEAKKIISKSYKFAKKTLKENKDFLVTLAEKLYAEGLLTGDEVKEMWNKYSASKSKVETKKKNKNK